MAAATEIPRERRYPELSLRLNFAWTFVGNVVYAGCQWGMLVVLAKLGSPARVGEFALALAVTAPILMFTNLALRAVQATDSRQEYTFGDYLGLRLLSLHRLYSKSPSGNLTLVFCHFKPSKEFICDLRKRIVATAYDSLLP